jgi:hypothetical protein
MITQNKVLTRDIVSKKNMLRIIGASFVVKKNMSTTFYSSVLWQN